MWQQQRLSFVWAQVLPFQPSSLLTFFPKLLSFELQFLWLAVCPGTGLLLFGFEGLQWCSSESKLFAYSCAWKERNSAPSTVTVWNSCTPGWAESREQIWFDISIVKCLSLVCWESSLHFWSILIYWKFHLVYVQSDGCSLAVVK